MCQGGSLTFFTLCPKKLPARGCCAKMHASRAWKAALCKSAGYPRVGSKRIGMADRTKGLLWPSYGLYGLCARVHRLAAKIAQNNTLSARRSQTGPGVLCKKARKGYRLISKVYARWLGGQKSLFSHAQTRPNGILNGLFRVILVSGVSSVVRGVCRETAGVMEVADGVDGGCLWS